MRYSRALALTLLPMAACLASLPASTQDCAVNANPACSAATNLGVISGDTGSSQRDLTAKVDLQVPAGMDYDLHVRCHSCSGITRSSTNDGSLRETIGVRRQEKAFSSTDDSFTIMIEVRHRCGTQCGAWLLTILGNAGSDTAALVCN